MSALAVGLVVVALLAACGPSYSSREACSPLITDKDPTRLAKCMENVGPWYCGGDAGIPNAGTWAKGDPHPDRYGNKSDHACTKEELDRAGFAPEVRPLSQR